MTEIELLTLIHEDLLRLISVILLFEVMKWGTKIFSMWKGSMKG